MYAAGKLKTLKEWMSAYFYFFKLDSTPIKVVDSREFMRLLFSLPGYEKTTQSQISTTEENSNLLSPRVIPKPPTKKKTPIYPKYN